MELFDLYTAEREKTDRKMVRGEPTPEGFYRLVVHVCIFDAQGRMLIQQRQPFKRGWSNLWDITVGGSAITGDYGDKLIALLDCVVLIEVPKQIRSQRVRDRSYQKFGDRILPGGDLYDLERKWFYLTDSRPDTYVTDWLKTVNCPVIRINGTLPVENNLDYIVSVLSDETK